MGKHRLDEEGGSGPSLFGSRSRARAGFRDLVEGPARYPLWTDTASADTEQLPVIATVPPVEVPARPRARRFRRQNVALLLTASAIGVWLGMSAPDVSPVAPPDPTSVTQAPAHPPAPVEAGVGSK
ncbi:hypothetical protein [Actinophytocola sp.]|uniref:hypothetical protein n=1 Tax=Actinophytocola sp. TaxID=1872138 RepID=UPI002ED47F9D